MKLKYFLIQNRLNSIAPEEKKGCIERFNSSQILKIDQNTGEDSHFCAVDRIKFHTEGIYEAAWHLLF